eukprot:scaffold190224_cov17-Prasinocladus_malaysianus.AAC.1
MADDVMMSLHAAGLLQTDHPSLGTSRPKENIHVVAVNPISVDEMLGSVMEIGKIAGADEAAAELVAGLRHRLACISDAIGIKKPRLLHIWRSLTDSLDSTHSANALLFFISD